MKKINIALVILSGFAVVGLTGCGCYVGQCEDEPAVENVTTSADDTLSTGTVKASSTENQNNTNDSSQPE